MKSTLTEQGIVVYIKGQYYLVNELTFKLLQYYYKEIPISEIACMLELDENYVIKLYKEISNKLLEGNTFKSDIDFKQPLKVQWKITNRCNIRCKHCYEGEKNREQLSDKQIAAVFDKLIESDIQELSITGGEALLVNNLSNYIHRCLDNGIRVNLFTNGILLHSFINDLGENVNKKLLTFEISVDGSRIEHDYIRGEGNYEKTIRNIKYAIRHGYKISTNTVINGITKTSIIQMMNELHRIGVLKIQLSNLMLRGWASVNKDELYISYDEVKKVYNEISKKIHFPFLYADITNNIYLVDKNNSHKKEGKNNWRCCAGQARVTIDFNGDVLLCPLCNNYSIGNIIEMSLTEIWNSPLRKIYREKLINLNKGKNVCFIYDQDIKIK